MIIKKVKKIKEYTEIERHYCCERLKNSRIAKIMEVDFEDKSVMLDLRWCYDVYVELNYPTIKYCPFCGSEFLFKEYDL